MNYRGYCRTLCLYTQYSYYVGLNNKLLFADDASASASVAARKHF